MRSATFAVSMLDPPPTPTNPSKSPANANSAASRNDASVGSTRTRSQIATETPAASTADRTR